MAKRIEAAPESPPLAPRLGGFKIQGPVRSAPAAKPVRRGGAPSAKSFMEMKAGLKMDISRCRDRPSTPSSARASMNRFGARREERRDERPSAIRGASREVAPLIDH